MDNPPFGESIIYFIVVFSNKPLQQFQEGRFLDFGEGGELIKHLQTY